MQESRAMTNSSLIFDDDYSYTWISECEDLRVIEQNIKLTDFEAKLKSINVDFEFRVLNRITMTNVHSANMLPIECSMFGKNRVANYTPFQKTQVILDHRQHDSPLQADTDKEKRIKDSMRRNSTGTIPQLQVSPKKSLINSTVKMRFDEESDSSQEENQKQIVVEDPSEWYINASYARHCFCKTMPDYVLLTQFPRQATLKKFFDMVSQKKVRQIVMLCKSNEKEIVEEDHYFLKSPKILSVGNYKVKCVKLEGNEFMSVRKLMIQRDASESARWDEFSVLHYKFKEWEDFGVIEEKNFDAFFSAISKIHEEFLNNFEEKTKSKSHPSLLVHCRAGIGRSGCFAVIFFIYDYLFELKRILASNPELKIEEDSRFEISVFGATRKVRECRWGAVDKPRQYFLIYQFTAYMIKKMFLV